MTRSHSILLWITLFSITSTTKSQADQLLVDSFSTGSFSLAYGGLQGDAASINSPLTDQRTVVGAAIGPTWTATLAEGSGKVIYSVNQVDFAPERNYLNFNYSRTAGSFSIAKYNAFTIQITDLTGSGLFVAFINGAPLDDIYIPITHSGEFTYSFSNLDTSRKSLNNLTEMNFRFLSTSANFGVSVDSIALVPEPSISLFMGFGCCALLARRRRSPVNTR